MTIHEECGYPTEQHADYRQDGKCVIDLPDEPKRYTVTARLTVEADNPHHAIQLFDSEYRDPLTVVHLHAEAAVGGTLEIANGERRNSNTVAY